MVGGIEHVGCPDHVQAQRQHLLPHPGQESAGRQAAESGRARPAAQLLDPGKWPQLLCRCRSVALRGFALCMAALLAGASIPASAAAPHKLMVLSVDGLDWRYIRDADQ